MGITDSGLAWATQLDFVSKKIQIRLASKLRRDWLCRKGTGDLVSGDNRFLDQEVEVVMVGSG